MDIKLTGNITHSQLEERIRKDLNQYVGVPLNEWNGAVSLPFFMEGVMRQVFTYCEIFFVRLLKYY